MVFFLIEHLPSIAEEILSHGILEDELKIAEYGNTTRKHLLQTSSLLEHLNRAGLVSDGTCFIDFGAGKGMQMKFVIRNNTRISFYHYLYKIQICNRKTNLLVSKSNQGSKRIFDFTNRSLFTEAPVG